MRAMALKLSSVSWLKYTISSTRLMNSGRRKDSSPFMAFSRPSWLAERSKPRDAPLISLPALEVMTMTVFSKLTTLPWASEMWPSSRICSSTLSTSGWAFSISSKSTTV